MAKTEPSLGLTFQLRFVLLGLSNYASNSTLALSQTYPNARSVITLSCGPSFAPLVVATTTHKSAAQWTASPSLFHLVLPSLGLILWAVLEMQFQIL